MDRLTEGKKLEWMALGLFIGLYALITAFHEPWFDEAQVWQIAKCASLRDMLFELPHYEGHPPLWSLLLTIPAKSGVPFELALKSFGLLISAASAFLVLFRTRFPRIVRVALPFSYFFFYQYGVIVRPYALMLLLMIALGLVFPTRNEHPWRVFALLLLLCLTSAYGIVLAGGLSLCIVWELWREKGTGRFLRELLSDSRTRSLLVLLVCALALIAEIWPRPDTYVPSEGAENPLWKCLLCALLTFPGECFLTFGSWFSMDRVLLQDVIIPPVELVCFCAIGCVLWAAAVLSSSRKNLKFLLVPYALFAIFAAAVHFSAHHLGIVFMVFLFWAILLSQDEDRFEIGRRLMRRLSTGERDDRLFKGAYIVVISACVLIPMVWTAWASVNEIRIEYSYGRHAVRTLDRLIADRRRIFCPWEDMGSLDPGESTTEDPEYINTYFVGAPILINAYYRHNICANLNNGNDDEAYIYFKHATYEESLKTLELWRQKGLPEVIVARGPFEKVFGDAFSYDDYTLVDLLHMDYIWKTQILYSRIPVFVRNELVEEYGFEPMVDSFKNIADGLQLTSEMQEQFENGVPVEEILKPYLDAMFGEEK